MPQSPSPRVVSAPKDLIGAWIDADPAFAASMRRLLRHAPSSDIPATGDLVSSEDLEQYLVRLGEGSLSLVAVGDIMVGGRAKRLIRHHGAEYPFRATEPLLRRAAIVLGNLEGPLARIARREPRNHSYRLGPDVGFALKRIGIHVLTLANNHLLDCGRAGVLETLDALAQAGIDVVGAGVDERAAHVPVVRQAGDWRVGLLGYYWNRRCAATRRLPGSAMDPFAALEADIGALRQRVDRVVVTFHWGIPYEREPSAEDRAKARFAVDCGADVVVGHHPHVIQPFEIHRGRPIFYSIGNFAFGSGNSRAEGLALGVRFEPERTTVDVYPLYVKNRDPRVAYQPKALRGEAAARVLLRVVEISGASGKALHVDGPRGRLVLPSPNGDRGGRTGTDA